jgi:hypothetical protein
VTVDFALPRVRRYNFLAQVSAIFCAGLASVIAVAVALPFPPEDMVAIADAFGRIPPLSTSTTSSNLTASPPETSDRRTSAATPFVFSAQARAAALLALPYPRYERASVREGPASGEMRPSTVAAIRSPDLVWIWCGFEPVAEQR